MPHPFSPVEPMVPPKRPQEIRPEDRKANDIPIDDNTQLVISLDVLFHEDEEREEEVFRLVQVATPTGVGQQRNCYLLVTSQATYIMRKGTCVHSPHYLDCMLESTIVVHISGYLPRRIAHH